MCSVDRIACLSADVNYGVIFILIITTGLEEHITMLTASCITFLDPVA